MSDASLGAVVDEVEEEREKSTSADWMISADLSLSALTKVNENV